MPNQEDLINFDEFEESLEETERSLRLLRKRFFQVKEDYKKKQELEQLKHQLKEEKNPKEYPLKTELSKIQKEIDQIELNLESNLFRWSQLQEPFWLIVRFCGLGVVIGLILSNL